MADLSNFVGAVLSHWIVLMTGSIVTVIVGFIERYRRKQVSWKFYGAVVFVLVFCASFLAWQDKHKAFLQSEDRVRTLTEEKKKLSEENSLLKTATAETNSRLAELELLLHKKPVEIRVRGERQLSDAETAKRRAIREQLGWSLREAEELKLRCLRETQSPPPVDDANKWFANVRKYLLENLDSSYEARFVSATGLSFSHGAPQEHENLWNGINVKAATLAKFIEELKD